MTGFRFIHSSDLHLGKRFGNLPDDIRGRLVDARHDTISGLISTARKHGADHILLAGDIFDTETPSDTVWRQARAAMESAEGVHWWFIPGNHDSLAAEALWDRFCDDAPANVHVLVTPETVEIAPRVSLLPAPVPSRFPGRDLTEWMSGNTTPEDHLRIGLAHGGVQTFGSEEDRTEIIPPDRAMSAGLDYLALGDWHGMKGINERTFYSGTPERDRFKHAGRGVCLAVTVPGRNATPQVEAIEIGRFDWSELSLPLTPEQDPAAAFRQLLPSDAEMRRDMLLKIRASGWIRLPDRLALVQAAEATGPEFCHFEFDETGLSIECNLEDLDEIAASGALRMAADTLNRDAEDIALGAQERAAAAAALRRLYSYVKGEAQ